MDLVDQPDPLIVRNDERANDVPPGTREADAITKRALAREISTLSLAPEEVRR